MVVRRRGSATGLRGDRRVLHAGGRRQRRRARRLHGALDNRSRTPDDAPARVGRVARPVAFRRRPRRQPAGGTRRAIWRAPWLFRWASNAVSAGRRRRYLPGYRVGAPDIGLPFRSCLAHRRNPHGGSAAGRGDDRGQLRIRHARCRDPRSGGSGGERHRRNPRCGMARYSDLVRDDVPHEPYVVAEHVLLRRQRGRGGRRLPHRSDGRRLRRSAASPACFRRQECSRAPDRALARRGLPRYNAGSWRTL